MNRTYFRLAFIISVLTLTVNVMTVKAQSGGTDVGGII